MKHLRRTARSVAVAVALALLSSAVTSTRLEVQDWDCPPAPASCARPVVVVGWPLPYISDFHGISVVGSADVIGALMGEDHFHWLPFLGNVAAYTVAVTGVALVVRRLRRM